MIVHVDREYRTISPLGDVQDIVLPSEEEIESLQAQGHRVEMREVTTVYGSWEEQGGHQTEDA